MIKQKRSSGSSAIAAPGGEAKKPPEPSSRSPLAVKPVSAAIASLALGRLACSMYSTRRERRRYFDVSLFGEVAWDMLLLLYWADAQGRGLNPDILTRAAGAPDSTALRWLKVLERKGLVVHTHNKGSHVSGIVELTDSTRSNMTRYLNYVASARL